MQKIVSKFIENYNLKCGINIRYMDLITEIGELGKEIIMSCDYGKQEHIKTDNLENEMGDCLFSLFALCHELNIDAEKALISSLSKYKERFLSKGEIGSDK